MTDENLWEQPWPEEDQPWPTSALRRKAPGLGVPGRVWARLDRAALPVLIGDILRDAGALTLTLRLDLAAGDADGVRARLCSVADEVIELDAAHRAALNVHLDTWAEAARAGGPTEVELHCHYTGWFWVVT